MKKRIETFTAIDDDGNQYTIHHDAEMIQSGGLNDPKTQEPGLSSYVTSTGVKVIPAKGDPMALQILGRDNLVRKV